MILYPKTDFCFSTPEMLETQHHPRPDIQPGPGRGQAERQKREGVRDFGALGVHALMLLLGFRGLKIFASFFLGGEVLIINRGGPYYKFV